jgi:coproporphyrinogen III oxidase-like Fe-S oxidoreductase
VNRYEISNYAAADGECQHNVNVWLGDTLLGVGASASGYNGIDRYTFVPDIEDFISKGSFNVDHTGKNLRMLEIFAVNLRTSAGWNKSQWDAVYPGCWDKMQLLSKRAAEKNPAWWRVEDKFVNLTSEGLLFWDDIAMDVLDWENGLEK